MREVESVSLASVIETPGLLENRDSFEMVNVRMTWQDLKVICDLTTDYYRQAREARNKA